MLIFCLLRTSPDRADEVIDALREHNFSILHRNAFTFSRVHAELFLRRFSSSDLTQATLALSSAPSLALLVSRSAAIDALHVLVGSSMTPEEARRTKPSSLTARFSIGQCSVWEKGFYFSCSSLSLSPIADQPVFYCSASESDVESDIVSFFPTVASSALVTLAPELPGDDSLPPSDRLPTTVEQVERILKAQAHPAAAASDSAAAKTTSLHELLSQGLIELCRLKPRGDDALLWLADWLRRHNPSKPRVQLPGMEIAVATSGNPSAVASRPISHASQTAAKSLTQSRHLLYVHSRSHRSATEFAECLAQCFPSYQVVDLPELLNTASKNSPQYGPLLTAYLSANRSAHIPANVIASLVAEVVKTSSSRCILVGFPASLDVALELQSTLELTPKQQLLLHLPIDHSALPSSLDSSTSAAASSTTVADDNTWHSRQIPSLLRPSDVELELFEHYKLFNAMLIINTGSAPLQQHQSRIKQLLVPLLPL